MDQVFRTIAIKNFLNVMTHADLAGMYHHNMEVQVNVAQDGGNRIEGDYKGRHWHGWTDGIQTWKAIRIPYKAKSNPEYKDAPLQFDLAQHAEGIGMTGWDWFNRCSRWVAFDFDAITGHSTRHSKKLTEEELLTIRSVVSDIPWVTLRKSTSGSGLHIYVFLNNVPTLTHTEHAAVARAILGKLSATAGYDFEAKVDTCGGNMWVWHRKMKGTDGLTLIKQGTVLEEVPVNWRDHMQVVTRKKTRNIPGFIEEQIEEIHDKFEELTSHSLRVPLDSTHKKIIKWIDEHYPGSSWWDQDHHIFITHTILLAECHEALGLRGIFKTNSQGREKGADHNAFMMPMSDGAFTVRRYTYGVEEDVTWEQDGRGWTRCYFNRESSLTVAARANEGLEDPTGGFQFDTYEQAEKALTLLGVNPKMDPWIRQRRTKVKFHKSGKLQVEINRETTDPNLQGWLAGRKVYTRMFDIKQLTSSEPEQFVQDDEVRHLITEQGDFSAWAIRGSGGWQREPLENVKLYIKRNHASKEMEQILGNNIAQPWVIVNEPFQGEFLPDRRWNYNAAQMAYTPTLEVDALKYDTWKKVLNHCGKGLDDAVSENQWCKDNAILTGADYLKCWIASVFQYPSEPLPYLFFYGPQECGKSLFHEMLQLLMTKGYQRADMALISQSSFNGELENAVICVVEETNLKKNETAYNRIKDWVTSRLLPVHKKGKQPYITSNTTHWIQCSNNPDGCPIFPGDTRIVMCAVPMLEKDQEIPKIEIIEMLKKEAPDFLAEVLNLELPPPISRLRIPVVETHEKREAETSNKTALELFLDTCYYVPGYKELFSEVYDRFIMSLPPEEMEQWSKIRVSREIPKDRFVTGVDYNNQKWVCNFSFTPKKEGEHPMNKYITKNGKIMSDTKRYEELLAEAKNGEQNVN